jgi:hypothetical protein
MASGVGPVAHGRMWGIEESVFKLRPSDVMRGSLTHASKLKRKEKENKTVVHLCITFPKRKFGSKMGVRNMNGSHYACYLKETGSLFGEY